MWIVAWAASGRGMYENESNTMGERGIGLEDEG